MATKQYIGARYVPLFYGAWVSGISYEPLTVVTYSGRSFTSKKQVPSTAGDPATATEYWIETGSYNAQVSQLQNDVTALTEKVRNKQRHIIFITASYGTKYTYNGVTITYSLDERFLQYSGWDSEYLHYSAVNGNGFGNGGFYTQLQNISLSGVAGEDIEDIYFMGGWNDASTSGADMLAAATTINTYCATHYPNARIHVMTAAWSYWADKDTSQIRTVAARMKTFETLGWLYHDNMRFVLHMRSRNIPNHFHPNQNGVDAIARSLIELVYTDDCNQDFETTNSLSDYTVYNGTLPANGLVRINQHMHNGQVYFQVVPTRGLVTLTETMTWQFDGNHGLTLLEYTDAANYILRGYQVQVGGPVDIVCHTSNGNTYHCPGVLYFNAGLVRVMFNTVPNAAGTGMLNIDNVVSYGLPNCFGTVQDI